jgi:hypothetical protein
LVPHIKGIQPVSCKRCGIEWFELSFEQDFS